MLKKYKPQNQKRLISLPVIFRLSALSLVLNMAPTLSHADTLQMPTASPTPKSYSVTLPGRGMTMTEVLEKFGEPQTRQPEVGEPPITRWVYPDYVVIFEYQYVIHALTTNKPMGFMPPKSTKTDMPEKMQLEKTTEPVTEKTPEMNPGKMHKPSQQETTTPHGH